MIVEGVFFDGKSARGRPASVWREGRELVVDVNSNTVARWPLMDIRFADAPEVRGGRLRLRLGHDGNERLSIPGDDAGRFIQSICTGLERGPITPKRAWRMVLLWGSGAIVSLAVLFAVIIPWAAQELAKTVPRQTEYRFGERIVENSAEVFALMGGGSKEDPICAGRRGQIALETLIQRLTLRLDEDIPLKVWTIRSNVVNAFAFPGGHIVIFEGLLDFVENPDELAGVLAHEIGHAIERHPTVLAVERAATAALIGLFFGDVTGGFALAAIGEAVVNASYSREMEREADAIAVRLMQDAQIDGSKLAGFLKRLAEREGDMAKAMGFLSSHPAVDERKNALPTPRTNPISAMSAGDWAAVRNMCR